MNWAQFTSQISDEAPVIAIGMGLFLVALFLRWKKDWWVGFRAYVTLGSGCCMLPLIWMGLAALIANPRHNALIQWLFQMAADGSAPWTNPLGKGVHALCAGFASDWLAWILAIVVTVWLLHDLFPRFWAIRGGDMPASTGVIGRGGTATRAKTVGDRLAALTAAEPHTMWIALFGPALIALIPPIAVAFNMPVGG